MLAWMIGLLVSSLAVFICLMGTIDAVYDESNIASTHTNGQELVTMCDLKPIKEDIMKLSEKNTKVQGYFHDEDRKRDVNVVDESKKEYKVTWRQYDLLWGGVKTYYK